MQSRMGMRKIHVEVYYMQCNEEENSRFCPWPGGITLIPLPPKEPNGGLSGGRAQTERQSLLLRTLRAAALVGHMQIIAS